MQHNGRYNLSSISEYFREVARFKSFSDTGKNFFLELTHDKLEHVMIKLYRNYHVFVSK